MGSLSFDFEAIRTEASDRDAPRRRDQESKKAEAEEKFGSIEEEVEKKTRKLEKLIRKVTEAEREVSDLSSEFQREREEMLDTIRQLARQIKLKDAILEGFAPSAKVKALEERAEWEDESWRLRPLEKYRVEETALFQRFEEAGDGICKTSGPVRSGSAL